MTRTKSKDMIMVFDCQTLLGWGLAVSVLVWVVFFSGVRWVGNYFLWVQNGFGINGGISEDGLNF